MFSEMSFETPRGRKFPHFTKLLCHHYHHLLRQVHSLFHSQFSTECDLMFPSSTSNYLSISLRLFGSCFLRRRFDPSFFFIFPSVTYRKQFLRKVWPIQLAFLRFNVLICRMSLSSWIICNTSSFFIRSVERNTIAVQICTYWKATAFWHGMSCCAVQCIYVSEDPAASIICCSALRHVYEDIVIHSHRHESSRIFLEVCLLI